MANTSANVPVNGRSYTTYGPFKETITDVTVSTNSEVVTAASLGLSFIASASGVVQTGQATDTGTYVTCTIAAGGTSVTVAEFTAAGAAATTAANTVIRVTARGY